MTELTFGVSIDPTRDLAGYRRLAIAAEKAGLEYIDVHDHPNVTQNLDAFVHIGDILPRDRAASS